MDSKPLNYSDNELPWTLINSYFKDKHLKQLVRHQLESYNYFVNVQIQNTINMFNSLNITSEQFYNKDYNLYTLAINIQFVNFKIHRPQLHENNGATKLMFPQDARLRNFTYSSNMTIDLNIEYVITSGDKFNNIRKINKTLPNIHIGKLPVMLKSDLCILKQYNHLNDNITGECKMDPGGYFIINGSEKTCIAQERAAENQIYCYNTSKSTKWKWVAEYKAVPDWKYISPKQLNIMISIKNNGFGQSIYIEIPRLKCPIPLFILFRAYEIISDKDICEKILLNLDDTDEEMYQYLKASIVDANNCMTYESAIKYITQNVIYTPINQDKDSFYKKKRDFALEILKHDIFPNAYNISQKIYMLGYMTNILLKTTLGKLPESDRDSYYNKRIDLTGILLNNLFRNYFNKFVKDMQKQIVKEMNNGSWRSNEDYENIINLTNIYKIVKSTTIENGLKRALSTGDFGIKQINNNKVGVAQVLNRLTYISSLSHLRRVNTPIDKSGKLIPPRRLHNSGWGYLCLAETPEGSSVGVVKNFSYLTHITIPSSSIPLYEYIESKIIKLNDEDYNSLNYNNYVKVFINGLWVGVTTSPEKLFNDLKFKKHSGIINVYTSIIFNYNLKEIRVCNDAGRLCRPLLIVKNNHLQLTNDILNLLDSDKLQWDDLCMNIKIQNTVIEYIDCYEQNNSLIAMNPEKLLMKDKHYIYKYTHCEIHASTIFGILAMCIPFPDHNQSPRNSYQAAMGKQAMGVYVTNYMNRMDKTSYVLNYPMRPLVDTRLMNIIRLNEIPSGEMVIVAIMSNTGYNQEDSILFNEGSKARGLFQATIYHTEKDEDKKISGNEEIRCKPDKSKTKGIKFANYDKINSNGVVNENTLIRDRDIIISKVIPIKENKNDHTKVIKYEDDSKMYKTHEETYIDKNLIDKNGDGYNFCKVKLRTLRQPVIGDKLSCYTPDHDVLTSIGWVNVMAITKNHKVASLINGINGNTLIYEYPQEIMSYECDEEIYEINTPQISLKVTKNHRMWVGNRDSKNFTIKTAEECYGKRWTYMKNCECWSPDFSKECPKELKLNNTKTAATHFIIYDENNEIVHELDINAWIKFFGIWISEGCAYKNKTNHNCYIDISAHKDRVKLVLDEIEDILQWKWYKCTENKMNGKQYVNARYRIFNKNIVNYMLPLSVRSINKSLPEWCWYLSKEQSHLLLLSMELGDGHVMKNRTPRYDTSSIKLANDYQRLCLHAGFSANLYLKYEAGHESYCAPRDEIFKSTVESYRLTRITTQNSPIVNKNIKIKTGENRNDKYVHYTGKVYCCRVENDGIIFVRRNGKVTWCGNSRHRPLCRKASCPFNLGS